MKNLAIIPARSGSKGVKDKNIKQLKGMPLLAYTIRAAIESEIFQEVLVSTDSAEYAEIAREYGADVPFLRSEEESTDYASSWDVVKECLGKFEQMGEKFDNVCLLQPTSPLRDANDIRRAYELFLEKEAISVVSVCEAEHSPLLSNTLNDTLDMNGFLDHKSALPRQKLETYYRINGAIYLVQVKVLVEESFLYRDGCYAFVMNQKHSVDIDSELDFVVAEAMLNDL